MADIAREDIRINTETISNEIMGSIGTKPKTQTDYVREHTPTISKKRKPKSVNSPSQRLAKCFWKKRYPS